MPAEGPRAAALSPACGQEGRREASHTGVIARRTRAGSAVKDPGLERRLSTCGAGCHRSEAAVGQAAPGRARPDADTAIVAFLGTPGAQTALGRDRWGRGGSRPLLSCLPYDISTLPFAGHVREKIRHVNHCPTAQLRCRSGARRVLGLRVQGARSPMQKMMNLPWMTSNLISLVLAFLAVSFLCEHPPDYSATRKGANIFPREQNHFGGGLAAEGAGLRNLEINILAPPGSAQ